MAPVTRPRARRHNSAIRERSQSLVLRKEHGSGVDKKKAKMRSAKGSSPDGRGQKTATAAVSRKRRLRILTSKRKKKVKAFMARAYLDPRSYGAYGSNAWISQLLACLDESSTNGPIAKDVRTWLVKYASFFQDTKDRVERKNPRQATRQRMPSTTKGSPLQSSCNKSSSEESTGDSPDVDSKDSYSSTYSRIKATLPKALKIANPKLNLSKVKAELDEGLKDETTVEVHLANVKSEIDVENSGLALVPYQESSEQVPSPATANNSSEHGNLEIPFSPAIRIESDGTFTIVGEFTRDMLLWTSNYLEEKGLITSPFLTPPPTDTSPLCLQSALPPANQSPQPIPASQGTEISRALMCFNEENLTTSKFRQGVGAMFRALASLIPPEIEPSQKRSWDICSNSLQIMDKWLEELDEAAGQEIAE